MKIVVLGGGGRVGRRIAEMLTSRNLGKVTIADHQAGDAVAGTTRVVVDVNDDVKLFELLATHDLVVNCVGPFDKWGGRILDAAIANKTDYVDICDDPSPTIAALERDSAAREAGVRAVIGMGASPGLSNLLGIVAARQLDEVDLLANYWGDPHEEIGEAEVTVEAERVAAAFRGGRAALAHTIAQASGLIPMWRDGKIDKIPAWKPIYEIRFSTGETGIFRPIGHPEPLTLPRYVKTRHSICVGTLGKGVDSVIESIIADVARGIVPLDDAVTEVARRIETNPDLLRSRRTAPPLPALIGAVAIGRKNGEARSVIAIPGGPTDGSMSTETARPCVVAIQLLDSVVPGVHPPEGAFDVDEFLQLFSEYEWKGVAPYRLDEQPGTMFELQVPTP